MHLSPFFAFASFFCILSGVQGQASPSTTHNGTSMWRKQLTFVWEGADSALQCFFSTLELVHAASRILHPKLSPQFLRQFSNRSRKTQLFVLPYPENLT
jgi:hypothetical protein